MAKKWLLFINLGLACLAFCLTIATCSVAWARPKEIPSLNTGEKIRPVPKNAFARSKSDYDAIEKTVLALSFQAPAMQLPNLKHLLSYFGPNGRPDVGKDATALHFALGDGKNQASIGPNQKLYLLYDRNQIPARYTFSPNNQETSLWLEANTKGNEAEIQISMKNEQGMIVQEPAVNARFTLQAKEANRFASSSTWELGKWRVDGTLLARQHTRWFGTDCFIQKHGGEEFEDLAKKERLDFGEDTECYSIYVGLDSLLAWENNRWQIVEPGENSVGRPLMQVKKIDERLMVFSLWDPEGKNMLTLNLLKSSEQWKPQSLQEDFKFLAARTRSQFVFEISKERMLMSPQDWLVLTNTGWKKLSSEQEIDDYVNREIVGPLFVFEGILKKEDNKQVIVGTLFNATRSETQEVEIEVPQANATVVKMPKNGPSISEESIMGNNIQIK